VSTYLVPVLRQREKCANICQSFLVNFSINILDHGSIMAAGGPQGRGAVWSRVERRRCGGAVAGGASQPANLSQVRHSAIFYSGFLSAISPMSKILSVISHHNEPKQHNSSVTITAIWFHGRIHLGINDRCHMA
jgi:hypothetical protein